MLPLFDAQDRMTEWIGTLTDVHDRRADERAQQRNSAFLSSALDTLPQLMLYADRDGVVRWMNRACADWLGVTPDELIGQSLLKLADATDRELLPRRIEAVLSGKAQRYSEVVTLRNRSATLDVSFVPHRGPAKRGGDAATHIEGFIWIGVDQAGQQRLLDDTQRWRLSG
jgi:PAS domain S-box-containing protein